ncbi:unnamed protein product [Fraxinus pennsylvanica]|uniref:Transducin/WD40 repeat-like superfamily protein n=1 Tax=Fraxinus pennsylvanica TaxID=56036 RepID=A0AAD2ADZ7_9LAMI|nr:unnamed protein product [Fraxinus pennsylvanica]
MFRQVAAKTETEIEFVGDEKRDGNRVCGASLKGFSVMDVMRKRARTSMDSTIVDVWKREVGELPSRNFAHRLAASEGVVLRLDILRKLEKHKGCVNTVSFNDDGDILISGSDDRRVLLWDWETGHVRLSFHSGHHNNVFQAKLMPYTDARKIVTCAADGQPPNVEIQLEVQVII